jgi:hypothetical protein
LPSAALEEHIEEGPPQQVVEVVALLDGSPRRIDAHRPKHSGRSSAEKPEASPCGVCRRLASVPAMKRGHPGPEEAPAELSA